MTEHVSLCVVGLTSATGEDLASTWGRFRARVGHSEWIIAPPGPSKSWLLVPSSPATDDDDDDDDEDTLTVEFLNSDDHSKPIAQVRLDVIMDKVLEPRLKEFKVEKGGGKARLCFLAGNCTAPLPTEEQKKPPTPTPQTVAPTPPVVTSPVASAPKQEETQPTESKAQPAAVEQPTKPITMDKLQEETSTPATHAVENKPAVIDSPAPTTTTTAPPPPGVAPVQASPATTNKPVATPTPVATPSLAPAINTLKASPSPAAALTSPVSALTPREKKEKLPKEGATYEIIIQVLDVKGIQVGGIRPPNTLVQVSTHESMGETTTVKSSNDPEFNSTFSIFGKGPTSALCEEGNGLLFTLMEERLMGNKDIASARAPLTFPPECLDPGCCSRVRLALPMANGAPAVVRARVTLWNCAAKAKYLEDRETRMAKPLPKAQYLQMEISSAFVPSRATTADNATYEVVSKGIDPSAAANSSLAAIRSGKVLNRFGSPKWYKQVLVPVGFLLQEVNLQLTVNATALPSLFTFDVAAESKSTNAPSRWNQLNFKRQGNLLKLKWRVGSEAQLKETNKDSRAAAVAPLKQGTGGRFLTLRLEDAQDTLPYNNGLAELHVVLTQREQQVSCMTLQRGKVTDIGDPFQVYAEAELEQVTLEIRCPQEPALVLGQARLNIPCLNSGTAEEQWCILEPREDVINVDTGKSGNERAKDVKVLNQYEGKEHFGKIKYGWTVQSVPAVSETQCCLQLESVLFPQEDSRAVNKTTEPVPPSPLTLSVTGAQSNISVDRNWFGDPGLFLPVPQPVAASQGGDQGTGPTIITLSVLFQDEVLEFSLDTRALGQRILLHAGFRKGDMPVHLSLLWVGGQVPSATSEGQGTPVAAPSPFSWLVNLTLSPNTQPNSSRMVKFTCPTQGFQPLVALDQPMTSIISTTYNSKEEFHLEGAGFVQPFKVQMDSLEEHGREEALCGGSFSAEWFHGNVGRTVDEEMAYRRDEEAGARAQAEDDGEAHMVRFVLQSTGPKQWEPRSTMGSTCTTIGQSGKALLVGGMNEAGILEPTATSYVALQKQWTLVGEHPLLARCQHSAVYYQGSIVLHAGIGYGGFDPTCVGDEGYQMPASVRGAKSRAATAAKQRHTTPQQRLAHKMSGATTIGYMADTLFLDPKTGDVEPLQYRAPTAAGSPSKGPASEDKQPVEVGSAAPPPRAHHTTVLVRDYLYVFGGWTIVIEEHQWTGGSFFRPAEVLSERLVKISLQDGTVHDVIERGTLPCPRADHAAVEQGNKMWIFGGVDANGSVRNDIFSYNCSSGVWQEVLPVGPVRSPSLFGHGVAVKDMLVTVIGAARGHGGGAQAFEFDLETCFWRKLPFDMCNLDGDRYRVAVAACPARVAEKRQKKLMPSETIPLLELIVVGGLRKKPTPGATAAASKCDQASGLCSKTCLLHIGKDLSDTPVQLSTAAQLRKARAKAAGQSEDPVLNLKSLRRGGDEMEKAACRLSRPKTAPGPSTAASARTGEKDKKQKLSLYEQSKMADRLSTRPPKPEVIQQTAPRKILASNEQEDHLQRVYNEAKQNYEDARQALEGPRGPQLSPTALRHSNQRQYYSVLETRKKNQQLLCDKYNGGGAPSKRRKDDEWGETVSRLHPRPPSPLSSQRK